MSGFKNFIMRGNLVELAVAVVIGTQFSDLVKQFVQSFVNPLPSLAGGKPNFGNLTFTVRNATFGYGAFLTDVLSFLISALVVYHVLVLPRAPRRSRRASSSRTRSPDVRAIGRSAAQPTGPQPRISRPSWGRGLAAV